MKHLLWVCLAVVVSLCCSCTRTLYVPVQSHRSEQVVLHDTIIEVRTVGETIHNHTADTVSLLHTAHAYSVASVTQGMLSHTLSVVPHSDSVRLQWREVHIIDSIPYVVPMPGERIEVVPAWVWWMAAAFLLYVVLAVVRFIKSVK